MDVFDKIMHGTIGLTCYIGLGVMDYRTNGVSVEKNLGF